LVFALILTLIVLALGVGFMMSGISLWRRLDGAQLTSVMILRGLIAVMSLRATLAVGPFALVGLVQLITMLVTVSMARRAICAPLTLFGQAIRNRSTGQCRI
jgi:ABC-type Na+ efflux pump permease subunit